MSKNVPNWVLQRQQKIKQEQEEYIKKQGKYAKLPLGETTVLIKDVPPTETIDKWNKKRSEYTVEIDGQEKLLSANVILDRAIIQALSEDINPITIIRTGKEKETRYSIKELESV